MRRFLVEGLDERPGPVVEVLVLRQPLVDQLPQVGRQLVVQVERDEHHLVIELVWSAPMSPMAHIRVLHGLALPCVLFGQSWLIWGKSGSSRTNSASFAFARCPSTVDTSILSFSAMSARGHPS